MIRISIKQNKKIRRKREEKIIGNEWMDDSNRRRRAGRIKIWKEYQLSRVRIKKYSEESFIVGRNGKMMIKMRCQR